MNRCIDHVPCPNCRSMGRDKHGDNLGVYEDGSVFCFSCSFTRMDHVSTGNVRGISNKGSNSSNILRIPPDSLSATRNGKASDWLQKYEIEQSAFDIKWSEKKQALVFSFYNQRKELIFYQLRLFAGKKRWQSFGPKPLFLLGKGDPVVLVEDILSAIKVSKVTTAVPLFGATIDVKRLTNIRQSHKDVILWLDYDKAKDKQTKKIIASCKALFEKTNQIITEKDPKAYSTEEIRYKISSL